MKKSFLVAGSAIAVVTMGIATWFYSKSSDTFVSWRSKEPSAVPSLISYQPGAKLTGALEKSNFRTSEFLNVSSDLEKVAAVMKWANGLWSHDGENDPDTTDPEIILQRAQAGEKFRCVEYSIVTVAAARALGLDARVVGLRTRDVETSAWGAGHVVSEIYLQNLRKWVMVDSQWGLIPSRNGTPLSAAEFAAARGSLLGPKTVDFIGVDGKQIADSDLVAKYLDWINPYLYYIALRVDQRLDANPRSFDQIILVPEGAKVPEKFQRNPIPGRVFPAHALESIYREVGK